MLRAFHGRAKRWQSRNRFRPADKVCSACPVGPILTFGTTGQVAISRPDHRPHAHGLALLVAPKALRHATPAPVFRRGRADRGHVGLPATANRARLLHGDGRSERRADRRLQHAAGLGAGRHARRALLSAAATADSGSGCAGDGARRADPGWSAEPGAGCAHPRGSTDAGRRAHSGWSADSGPLDASRNWPAPRCRSRPIRTKPNWPSSQIAGCG